MFVLYRNVNGNQWFLTSGNKRKFFSSYEEAHLLAIKLNSMLLKEVDPSDYWTVAYIEKHSSLIIPCE
ncbi:hypothetical protein [Shouchella lehensis]|uniref:Uncharacterized protein n=1 Tax=Shouchella lehensis G1 TaxID=1246626 RepID=A0A060LRL5_9BACI|nr:hypothetical protein [Shouchella lehensis]AIC92807.1 hypothetical protein BleG1_0199 [Shouchella lehensis G1]